MTKFLPEQDDDDHPDMWLIKYEDGDAEHMYADEVSSLCCCYFCCCNIIIIVVVAEVSKTVGDLCWWSDLSSSSELKRSAGKRETNLTR